MGFEAKAAALFIDFPIPPSPATGTAHCREHGKLLWIGGALPFGEGRIQGKGRVGLEIGVDQARLAARLALVQALATVRGHLGTLDRIRQILTLTGYIASGSEFQDHAKVFESATQLLTDLFGGAGLHARTLLGVATLPLGACAQVDLLVEVK
ncbi:MAG: RidA family protein [Deltaproteobacteria bacterium]|nr:RidA family protein [Deltaproteobacteria bacterium]